MSAATVLAELGTGASVTWATAESGLKWNREDTLAGTTPVPIPGATGTNYSWLKSLALYVTVVGTTSMSNRRIQMSGAPATGLTFSWKAVAVASYVQSAVGNLIAASGTNDAVPSTYTAMTTSPVQYDNTGVATTSTGPSGSMAVCVAGLSNLYVSGAGNANAAPSLIFTYDEA
jgi:hypothetical protein